MSFWDRVMPRDVIAAILIVGGIFLKAIGLNGTISAILVCIAGFYFGAEILQQKTRFLDGEKKKV